MFLIMGLVIRVRSPRRVYGSQHGVPNSFLLIVSRLEIARDTMHTDAYSKAWLTHSRCHVANISTAIQAAGAQSILNAASARMLRVSYDGDMGSCKVCVFPGAPRGAILSMILSGQ